jgi:hypothetical protein
VVGWWAVPSRRPILPGVSKRLGKQREERKINEQRRFYRLIMMREMWRVEGWN